MVKLQIKKTIVKKQNTFEAGPSVAGAAGAKAGARAVAMSFSVLEQLRSAHEAGFSSPNSKYQVDVFFLATWWAFLTPVGDFQLVPFLTTGFWRFELE